MALTYLKIFADMEETLSLYSDEERGRLLSAMMAYSFRGEEPEFSGQERFVWPMLRNHIDSCEERSEKMKANGRRGGRPESKDNQSESKDNQTKPNETKATETESKENPIQEQEQEQEQEHVHDQDHKSTRGKRERFVPPTVQECEAFFTENGGTVVQATKFFLNFESKNWKAGREKLSNWHSRALKWILDDKEGGFSAGNRASPPKPQEIMLRHSEKDRKAAYSAAVVNFDEEE